MRAPFTGGSPQEMGGAATIAFSCSSAPSLIVHLPGPGVLLVSAYCGRARACWPGLLRSSGEAQHLEVVRVMGIGGKATVGELRRRLIDRFPRLVGLLEKSAFAVNDEIAAGLKNPYRLLGFGSECATRFNPQEMLQINDGRSAVAELRLGHLRRRRLDPRAHAHDRAAHPE